MIVKATREGLEGLITATGWKIDNHVSFCALPSVKAKGRHVKIINAKTGDVAFAEVLDVGPWSEIDDDYVFGNARPLSESNQRWMYGKSAPEPCPQSNHAGIDLGEKVWNALHMQDNTEVDWYFL